MTIDLGSVATLTTNLTDPLTHLPVDPTTMTLTATKPDGTVATPAVTRTGVGAFQATVTTDLTGVWLYKWVAAGTVVSDSSGQFTVTNPAPPGYCTLAEIKLQTGINDASEDALILKAIGSASRAIERACNNRQFYLSAVATPRVYLPTSDVLLVDDIGTLAGIIVETGSMGTYTAVASTAYEMQPMNATDKREPWTQIQAISSPALWFTGGWQPRVRVTAQWGWPGIPDEVSSACLIQATRWFRRKGSPEGVAGFNDMGVVRLSKLDPDVATMLGPFRDPGVA